MFQRQNATAELGDVGFHHDTRVISSKYVVYVLQKKQTPVLASVKVNNTSWTVARGNIFRPSLTATTKLLTAPPTLKLHAPAHPQSMDLGNTPATPTTSHASP